MKTKRTIAVLGVIFVFAASPVFGEAELTIQRTFKTSDVPLDAAVSADGRRVFVLSSGGRLMVYGTDGRLEEILHVGEKVDQIKSGPRGDILFLISSQEKTVQMATLDFVRPINTAGSPSMGPPDAPVVIAVFTDFQ